MIIIDDGSPDGTLEAAKQLQKIYGSDRIVSFMLEILYLLYQCILAMATMLAGKSIFKLHRQKNFQLSAYPLEETMSVLTLSYPEALPSRVKSSGIKQSKITKGQPV